MNTGTQTFDLLCAVAPHRSQTNLDSWKNLSSFFASLTAHTFKDLPDMALSPFRDTPVFTFAYLPAAAPADQIGSENDSTHSSLLHESSSPFVSLT
jgi:hypothetical protein